MADPQPTAPTAMTLHDAQREFAHDVTAMLPDGRTWACRRPDLRSLLLAGLVKFPTLAKVMGEMTTSKGTEVSLTALVQGGGSPEVAAFIDHFVCLAAKSPAVSPDEGARDAVWIGALPLSVKLAIFKATFKLPEDQPAAAEFRGGADGSADPPDGGTVPRAPEHTDGYPPNG